MKTESGLENVVAAETGLSHVDGAAGELIVRGKTLDDLAAGFTYENVVSLMLADRFDGLSGDMTRALGEARIAVFERMDTVSPAIADLPLIDAVGALMATLPDDTDLQSALRLIVAPAVFSAVLIRCRAGLEAIPPRPDAGHATDSLAMAGLPNAGNEPAALDRYLMTVVDHGLNASTFAARVVASTGAGLTASSLAALGALKGPLHGGAPGPVLDMLDAIGSPVAAEKWIAETLGRGERLMGFGHRVYRVRDPRADALRGAVDLLRAGNPEAAKRLALAEEVERAALAALARHKPDRKLETNVEFYTAMLLEALGFPRDAFTCVFAMGRVTGWIAHAREQAETGRLIRPRSRYIGPTPQEAA